jgi:hypothetical protein
LIYYADIAFHRICGNSEYLWHYFMWLKSTCNALFSLRIETEMISQQKEQIPLIQRSS